MAKEKDSSKNEKATESASADVSTDDPKVKQIKIDNETMDILEGQPCPMCREKTLTLMEQEREIPYFGKVYLFSMNCSGCNYHKADIECVEEREPAKYEIEISGEKDMHIRIVKSSEATVKIPHICTIESGPAANGYITNVEGILNRVKKIIEGTKEGSGEEDDNDKSARKKAKNLLKKIQKAEWGQDKLKIIIEDPTGNSAIISDKAVVTKMKKK
ncbi:MAG: ZPR1 zinc finger domain-containing protein [Nanoarchaeota archaeon]|nr:ZPR1 zinc finger domain-containing protein [Nanoarchaeota archaeon]